MTHLTVFHDPTCGLCRSFRSWLERQALWIPVSFVAFDTEDAKACFPGIGALGADRDCVVLADDGHWWQGPDAWLVCLWATKAYRVASHQLATPLFKPWLSRIVHAISSNRLKISKILALRSERELGAELSANHCEEGTCRIPALQQAKTLNQS